MERWRHKMKGSENGAVETHRDVFPDPLHHTDRGRHKRPKEGQRLLVLLVLAAVAERY